MKTTVFMRPYCSSRQCANKRKARSYDNINGINSINNMSTTFDVEQSIIALSRRIETLEDAHRPAATTVTERQKARLRVLERIEHGKVLEREAIAAIVLPHVPERLHGSLNAKSIELLRLVTTLLAAPRHDDFDKQIPHAVEVILDARGVDLTDDVVAWLEELAGQYSAVPSSYS